MHALTAGQNPSIGRGKELVGRKVGARSRFGGKYFCAVLAGLAFAAFTILLALASPAHADALRDKPPFHQLDTYKNMLIMDQIETNWLYDLSMDFIKNGLAEYYKTGNKKYADKIYEAKGYSLLIRDIEYLTKNEITGELLYKYTRIVASARHIENELWCIYQQEYKGIIYEYWLLKLHVKNRHYPFRY